MITIQDIAKEFKASRSVEVDTVLVRLIIKALSPLEKKVYDFILREWPSALSSHDVAKHIDRKLNHTGNLLSKLCDVGLLVCEIEISESGARNLYKAYLEWEIER